MTPSKKSKLSKLCLQLLYISFLGYHGGVALYHHFNFSLFDTVLIIAVIEISVVMIDWVGLNNRTLWLFKTGLLFCSVFFSIYGFIASYTEEENQILRLQQANVVETNESKIARHRIDITSFNQQLIELKADIKKFKAIGDQTAGAYKGKSFTGNDAARWREHKLKSVLNDISEYQKDILDWQEQDKLSKNKIDKAKLSIQMLSNELRISWIKYFVLGALVLFIASINMFISNITVSLEQSFKKAEQIRKKNRYNRFTLDKNKEKSSDKKIDLMFSFGTLLSYLNNKGRASP